MARLSGFFAAAVASAPNPISISPSPVTTKTRRFGCARASPNPTVTALPIAPEIKIERVIADSRAVIGRRAETGYHEHIAAIGQYSSDRAAAQQLVLLVHRFSP